MIAFGPVLSKRLGKILEINNIPEKNCSYSCVYCRVGKTSNFTATREEYYKPEDVLGDVQEMLIKVKNNGEKIDYFTFLPDGEPTLDINLGQEIDLLKLLDHRIAILTNGSLIAQESVKDDLMKADYVSFKIDTITKKVWEKINCPHKTLHLEAILESMVNFSSLYSGKLTTSTILIEGMNTSLSQIQSVAKFISELKPYKVYVATPKEAISEKEVRIPDEVVINRALKIFREEVDQVEYLID